MVFNLIILWNRLKEICFKDIKNSWRAAFTIAHLQVIDFMIFTMAYGANPVAEIVVGYDFSCYASTAHFPRIGEA